jgi:DNA-3-methyladenine glycosylase II
VSSPASPKAPPPGAADPGDQAPHDQAAAIEALRKSDPVLRQIIDEVGPIGDFFAGRPTDHYGTLVRSIVGQQLSTASANAIYKRLIEKFGGHAPTPEEVLATDPDELRTAAGLSHAKVKYLRSLAEHVLDGSLRLDRLHDLSDEQVTAELVSVNGIGEWSADMFLILHLHRPDVLAAGDLGIRRAVMIRYGLPAMPKPAEVYEIGERWRPYRTLACLYLWRSLHTEPI